VHRPPVSVIVPFHGDEAAASATMQALRALELRAADELLVADNTERGAFKAIELLVIATEHAGRLAGNARPPEGG
jgi:hypothetical protein